MVNASVAYAERAQIDAMPPRPSMAGSSAKDAAAPDDSARDMIMALSIDPNNWVMWGYSYDGTRYSPPSRSNGTNDDTVEMYNELYNGSVTCEEMRSLWAGTLLGDSVVFFGCPERGFGDEPYNHLYNHRPLSDFPAVFGPAKLDS